jgi:hypothetical protein
VSRPSLQIFSHFLFSSFVLAHCASLVPSPFPRIRSKAPSGPSCPRSPAQFTSPRSRSPSPPLHPLVSNSSSREWAPSGSFTLAGLERFFQPRRIPPRVRSSLRHSPSIRIAALQ